MAFEHAAADRHEDAVTQKAQYGKARDTGEHQVEPDPFLAIADDVGEADLGADQLGGEQYDKGMGQPDADAGEKLRGSSRNDDTEEDRALGRAHVLRRPDENRVDRQNGVA